MELELPSVSVESANRFEFFVSTDSSLSQGILPNANGPVVDLCGNWKRVSVLPTVGIAEPRRIGEAARLPEDELRNDRDR
jgi:hypothetical protein